MSLPQIQELDSENVPLHLQSVTIGYGGPAIVQTASLDIKSGETFGLIGLNGAGKTTLIKSILGLLNIQSGKIEIFSQPPGHKKSKNHLAYLPERFEPAWFLNGIEFLKFSLKLYGLHLTDEELVKGAESLRLDPAALKKKVRSYSKGMRQKLGLLGTILTDCPLLILDEPMSGLDPVARTLVKDQLSTIKSQGRTVFLSSHILADMEEICDRVAVLHDGEIQFVGTPENLKEKTGQKHLERAFLKLIDA